MTKRAAAVAASWAVLLLAAAPAAGHGLPAPRSIDTRVLADEDGQLAFAGCVEGVGCQFDGLDLLALDMREAANATGRPMVVFRITFQTEMDSFDGTTLTLSFKAGGKDQSVVFTMGANATGDAARIDGPFDVGDGHPKGIDAWFDAATLGVAVGDAITDIRLRSSAGAQGADDIVPGTWQVAGNAVPFIPDEPDVPEAPPAGTYTLAGPALLANATVAGGILLHGAPASTKVTVRSLVADLPQFATLRLESTGANATLDATGLNLADAAPREATVTVRSATPGATLAIVATTDLGGYQRVPVPLEVHAVQANTTTPQGSLDPAQSGAPAPAPVLGAAPVLLVLALAAARRREA